MIVPEKSHKLVQHLGAPTKAWFATIDATGATTSIRAIGRHICVAVVRILTLIRQLAPPLHPPGRSHTTLIAIVVVIIVASTANRYLNCMMDVGFVRYETLLCNRSS